MHSGLLESRPVPVFPDSGIGQGFIPDAHTIAVVGEGHLRHFAEYRDNDSKPPTVFPEYPLFAKALDYQ